MRSVIVVEVFPGLELGIETHTIGVGQQLVKVGLVRSVGTLDLAVQLGCLGFDVDMSHALVFDMPVKAGLKLMPSVGADRADPEGKRLDHVVQGSDRTCLVMFGQDL